MSDHAFNCLRISVLILASADWLLSAVLVRIHLNRAKPSYLDWTCGGVFDCSSVLTSPYSQLRFLKPWPVPVAAAGLAHFTLLGVWLLMVGRLTGLWHQAWAIPAIFGAAGLFGSLYFVYVMWSRLRAWCGLCLSVHAVHLLLVPGLWILWLAGPGTGQAASSWQIPVLALLTGGAIGLALIRYVQAHDAATQADKIHRKLDRTLTEQFVTSMPMQIPITAADPISGPIDAPHTVVLFEDFQCPTCAEVNTALRYVQQHLPGALRVVHKDFPLNAACNPSRQDDAEDHAYACQAAAAAEAARRLCGDSAFARMRDMLFANQALLPRQPYEAFARSLGLEVEAFNRLRASPDVLREIQKDACTAAALDVRSTPAVFVDGRRLKNPVIQRGQAILLEETLEHWQDLLRSVSFGAKELGFSARGMSKE